MIEWKRLAKRAVNLKHKRCEMKLFPVFCFFLLFFSLPLTLTNCSNQSNQSPQQLRQESQQRTEEPRAYTQPKTEFNNSDKSAGTNGNVLVAIQKLNESTPEKIWADAQETSPATITKSPYSSIGKLLKLTGSVYKVEEVPPSPNLTGKWAEVLMLVQNPNSQLGATTLDFMYNGDIEKVNPNTYITCAGYFVGTYESKNAYGGTVECIMIVGNIFKE